LSGDVEGAGSGKAVTVIHWAISKSDQFFCHISKPLYSNWQHR